MDQRHVGEVSREVAAARDERRGRSGAAREQEVAAVDPDAADHGRRRCRRLVAPLQERRHDSFRRLKQRSLERRPSAVEEPVEAGLRLGSPDVPSDGLLLHRVAHREHQLRERRQVRGQRRDVGPEGEELRLELGPERVAGRPMAFPRAGDQIPQPRRPRADVLLKFRRRKAPGGGEARFEVLPPVVLVPREGGARSGGKRRSGKIGDEQQEIDGGQRREGEQRPLPEFPAAILGHELGSSVAGRDRWGATASGPRPGSTRPSRRRPG